MTRAIALFAVLLLVGTFALLNWPAFTAITPLDVGFTVVQAPLGLLMLGLLVFLSLAFTMWAISLQASAIAEARRHTRELQAQRELADKAEASRFVELRGFLAAELSRATQASIETRADVLTRLHRMHEESSLALEQSTNSLAASLGELEDRLERSHVLPPPEVHMDVAPLRR